MGSTARIRQGLRDILESSLRGRTGPSCEGRVLYLVDHNPGGEAVRITTMGRRVVKVLDRAVFERACAAAMAGR